MYYAPGECVYFGALMSPTPHQHLHTYEGAHISGKAEFLHIKAGQQFMRVRSKLSSLPLPPSSPFVIKRKKRKREKYVFSGSLITYSLPLISPVSNIFLSASSASVLATLLP